MIKLKDVIYIFNQKYKSEINKKTIFLVTKNTSRAIELLNESSYQNIFNQSKIPDSDIIFPYRVYFQLLNNDSRKLNDKEFFNECCKYFKNKKQIGKYRLFTQEILLMILLKILILMRKI